jgi:hypothetical protein
MREFDQQVADEIRQWAEAPPALTAAPYCFKECLINCITSHLVAESETIYLLQWTKSGLIPSSN